jgi:photosystem II stability/assembly factor-like uncharacterized protein
MRSSWWTCGLALLAVALAPAPAAAGIWTRIQSNTTSAIDAVEYQSDGRFWFATHDGRIYRRSGTSFVAEFGGLYDFNGIAFQPAPGSVGVAVTQTGQVFRTSGGGTWSPVSMVGTTFNQPCSGPGSPATPAGPFYDVEWATPSTAYIVGSIGLVLQSTDAGLTWHEVSRQPDGTCRVPDWVSDMATVPSAPNTIYFLTREGRLYRTTNALATAATLVSGPSCGPTSAGRSIVLDPAASQRLWQTTWCTGLDSLLGSTTAGQSFARLSWPFGGTPPGLRDLAFAGGTLVAVGTSDTIVTSPNGVHAYAQPSGMALNWRHVDMASATHAAVVGDAGAIVVTGTANSIPPPPPPPDRTQPTGTIAGPDRGRTGTRLTYALQGSDIGGSGIDPRGFTWTLDGKVVGGTTGTLVYGFRFLGRRQLQVIFKDLAGNRAAATKTLYIDPADVTPDTTSRVRAKRRGSRVVIRVRTRFTLPDGISLADGCRGKATLALKRKGKLVTKRATVRIERGTDRRCPFGKRFRVKARKLGSARRLDLAVDFKGNQSVGRTQWVKKRYVKVPRRR